MTKAIIIFIMILGMLLVIAISAYFAYKNVICKETVCINKKIENEGDVSLDDIADKYLRLTNIE